MRPIAQHVEYYCRISMRAAIVDKFGAPASQVRIGEMPAPCCDADGVVIRVAAAGVNPVDWKECEGLLAQFFTYSGKWIPGFDAAGVIDQVGANVTAFKPGDRVVCFSDRAKGHDGAFAEYVHAPVSL